MFQGLRATDMGEAYIESMRGDRYRDHRSSDPFL